MKKDFDLWNQKKKELDKKFAENSVFFKEAEVWWVHIGLNIGFETNGKGDEFTRPALIIKKYNQFSFLAVPLSTSVKIHRYHVSVGSIDGKDAIANLSQIKNIDSRRLVRKICTLEKGLFEDIKRKTSQVNFS